MRAITSAAFTASNPRRLDFCSAPCLDQGTVEPALHETAARPDPTLPGFNSWILRQSNLENILYGHPRDADDLKGSSLCLR